MSMLRILFLMTLCGLGIACAKGTPVETDQVTKIRPGVTTQADVRQWFGEPDRRELLGSEGTRWFYIHESVSKVDSANTAVDTANLGLDVFRAVGQGAGMSLPTVPGARARSRQTDMLEIAFDPEGIVKDYAYQGR
jgi:outer membrane protein assembly factor BamE (lipoprotein component of BamABCDE complex)